MAGEKILLGHGILAIDSTPVGLTRGGSNFSVEREVREIVADGDYGPVKDRIVIDREVATLTLRGLELFKAEEMTKFFPGSALTAGVGEDTFTSTLALASGDYHEVTWTGKTKDGKPVVITVENAINMGNFELTLEDKNEVVPELVYTATYLESERETPHWDISLGKGASYSAALTIQDGVGNIEGAIVYLYSTKVTTGSNGVAAFANIPEGIHEFKVVAAGYETYFASIEVDGGAFTDTVTLTAIA